MTPEVRLCKICKREFQTGHRRIFCSSRCAKEHLRIYQKEYYAYRRKQPINKLCKLCGNQFKTIRSNQITCSSRCQSELNRIRINQYHVMYDKGRTEYYREYWYANRERRIRSKRRYRKETRYDRRRYEQLRMEYSLLLLYEIPIPEHLTYQEKLSYAHQVILEMETKYD